jgi:N-acetylglucosaminyldiphosphoundecaprenol N-acetyl-beta-D-mannosaminyltransferase
MRRLVVILGVPVDILTTDEALDRVDEMVAAGRATGRVHQVATVNADFVVNALHDPELRRILQRADMTTADGMPIVWGGRLLGAPLPDRVTGVDLIPPLAGRAAERGYSLFLLGARPGVAARAAEKLVARNPGLRIAGVLSPPQSPLVEMDPGLVAEINAACPDILLVAFGNPKQEKWIAMHAPALRVPVCIGVGGTLDFIAGETRRAPRWMRQRGLEWLFRLAQEPRRLWRRYAHDLASFGTHFAGLWLAESRAHANGDAAAELISLAGISLLSVAGVLGRGCCERLLEQGRAALAETPFLAIDLSGVTALDACGAGDLVSLAGAARAAGGDCWLVAPSRAVRTGLARLRLDSFFRCYPDSAPLATPRPPVPPAVALEPFADGWVVVRLPRALDAMAAEVVARHCGERLAEHPRLVVDLSQTIFLSSDGIAALADLARQIRAAGGELRLAGCSSEVTWSLQQLDLEPALPLFDSLEEAVGGLREEAVGASRRVPIRPSPRRAISLARD